MTDQPQLEAPAPVEPSVFEQVRALATPLVVRIDRSRDIAEVHGDRPRDDPLANTFFFQDKLPFNAQGHLLYDHPDVQNDPQLLARAEKLLKRALKLHDSPRGGAIVEEEDSDEAVLDPEPLKMTDMIQWAAGEKNIQWQEISNLLARKYFVRVPNKKAALELMLEKQVLSINALSRSNRKLVEVE